MDEIYKNLSLENLENEIWRDIVGYEDKYQVSSYGRIKSLRDKYGNYREKILSQYENKNGYLYVMLCKEGKMKLYRVNRLVATAFIENPNNFRFVNHKNEIKTDNCVSNLEWCTQKYNCNYGNCPKKIAEKLSRQVYQYDKNDVLISIWQSTAECGRNGYNFGAVAACCRNCYMREGNNIYKNYIWSYTPIDSK